MASVQNERTFVGVLKQAMRARGENTETLAKSVGQKPATFRQWLTRGTFPDDALQKLAVFVSWQGDIDSLRSHFGLKQLSSRLPAQAEYKIANPPTELNLKDAVALMDQRLEEIDPHDRYLESRTHDVALLMGAWRKPGDVFIYWSLDEIPYEMRSEERLLTAREIAQGVASGAAYIYLHADEHALQALRSECGLRRLPLASSFVGAFESFQRTLVAAHDEADGSGGQEFGKLVEQHVVRIATPAVAFAAPGHKYMLFQSNGMQPRAFGVFPTGTLQKPRLGLSTIPLDQDVTTQFLDFVSACLRRDGPHRELSIIRRLAP